MAKVRAYKIAEELGIDRNEFLKKAAEVGIELRSPMVSLDAEEVTELRRRLGVGDEVKREERRVGTSVIRRRRRVVAEPKPAEPEAPAPEEEEAPSVPEPAPVEAGEPIAAEAPEAEPTPVEAPPAVTEPEPVTAAPSEAAPSETLRAAAERQPAAPVPPRPATTEERPAPGKRLVRRQAIQGIQVREQEALARMLRGNVQSQLERRRQIVEQQSRIQPRRRRGAQAAPRKPLPARDRKKIVKLDGPVSLQELSRLTGVKVSQLLRVEGLGEPIERGDLLDVETAGLVAAELGFEVRTSQEPEPEEAARVRVDDSELEHRPPIVTVMGHVDHGKTSLLDTIRKTNVVAGEVGGITQHIGAYKVQVGEQEIAFLDTPGHEAFTHMRARGAQLTDVAVLVVAADDGVMPQTAEAIAHAKAAGVPIIVAINKIDLPDANAQRVKQALLEHELVAEDFGGDTICVEVSAKRGDNVDKLLEMIGLQAEILELKARPTGRAEAIVGPVATVLVRQGVLKQGDTVVVGTTDGRVRALLNERGEKLKQAGPSTPAQIVGLAAVPEAGEDLIVVQNDREAKAIVEGRLEDLRRKTTAETSAGSMDAEVLFRGLTEEEEKELRIVLKTDVHGTMEAVRDALEKLSTEKAKLKVIHCGVGAITESDVMLAAASEALAVGFHVRPEPAARKAAEQEGVDIRTYEIVYEALDDMTQALQGLLPPQITEKLVAHAEVRQLFQIPRIGTVAGCYVAEGTFARANPVRVVRDGVITYKGRVGSLRRFKDNVREVQSGLECGIGVENFNDVKVGDILESYVVEETPATL
jgi:translation initiation factor IF-2